MVTKINVVLLVDDSAVSSRLVSMLEDADNTQIILQATNSKDALRMMHDFKPDYVLIDIALSGKTGMHLIEQLRVSHASSKIAVITNLANQKYKDYCEQMGANYFLDKSTDFELIPTIFEGAQLN